MHVDPEHDHGRRRSSARRRSGEGKRSFFKASPATLLTHTRYVADTSLTTRASRSLPKAPLAAASQHRGSHVGSFRRSSGGASGSMEIIVPQKSLPKIPSNQIMLPALDATLSPPMDAPESSVAAPVSSGGIGAAGAAAAEGAAVDFGRYNPSAENSSSTVSPVPETEEDDEPVAPLSSSSVKTPSQR